MLSFSYDVLTLMLKTSKVISDFQKKKSKVKLPKKREISLLSNIGNILTD